MAKANENDNDTVEGGAKDDAAKRPSLADIYAGNDVLSDIDRRLSRLETIAGKYHGADLSALDAQHERDRDNAGGE